MKQRAVSFPDCSQEGVGGNSPVNSSRFATTAFNRLRILETYQHIAMIGLSANPFRPSHSASIYLMAEGYDVIPVNPRESRAPGSQMLSVAPRHSRSR